MCRFLLLLPPAADPAAHYNSTYDFSLTRSLTHIASLRYKFVDLISLEFARADEQLVQQHITYRYNAMKSRLALMQSRLQELNNIVRMKSPGLLMQLHRPTASSGGATGGSRKKGSRSGGGES